MPYKRYFRKVRRYNAYSTMKYKRRRQGITGYSLMLAKKALRKVNVNNRAKELKYFDVSENAFTIDASGNYWALCSPQKGTDSDDRLGNKIYMSSSKVNLTLYTNALANVVFRVILYLDKSDTVGIDNLFTFYSGAAAPGISVLSMYNRDTKLDYRVLFDKTYYLSSSDKSIKGIKLYRRIKSILRIDDSETIQHNNLKLAIFSNIASNAGTKPQIFLYSRVYYTDD